MASIRYPGVAIGILAWPFLSDKQRKKIIKKRLDRLVKYAREKSPYLKEFYKDLPENFELKDIPYTTKPQMYEHFNSWHTVPGITWEGCDEFSCYEENRGKKYHGTLITATSGSTGHPIVVCLDQGAKVVTTMLSLLRDIKLQFPMTSIFMDEGFDACSAQLDSNRKASAIARMCASMINSQLPKEEIVKELNKIKPRTIISYSNVLFQLLSYSDDFKFRPRQILASGEYLSKEARKVMKERLNCSVKTMYACTEAGPMASECKCGHLHIHEDWVIVEAVDENNNPVPSGVQSDKVLVTCLSNYAQPIIRYEMTDRIVLHDEPCPCGKRGKWLEVEGRSSDILHFDGENGKVDIPTILVFEVIESKLFAEVLTYQFILHNNNVVEARITPAEDYTKEELFERIKPVFLDFLLRNGVKDPKMVLSETVPQKATANGKIKRFYQDDLDYEA